MTMSSNPYRGFRFPPEVIEHAVWRLCQGNRLARDRGRRYSDVMAEISYRRHRFPPVVIQHAGSICVSRSSYRDVEDLLAGRGLDVSYETIRSWGPHLRT
jgi:transposase-like protein